MGLRRQLEGHRVVNLLVWLASFFFLQDGISRDGFES